MPESAREIGTEFDVPLETGLHDLSVHDLLGEEKLRAQIPAGGRVQTRKVGRCELFAEIARGGMATIHLGRWLGAGGFSRPVAVKALHPQYAADPEFLAMFLDEARVVARIRHPNVMPTIDLVDEDDQLYIVMEYVDGVTLAHLLARAVESKERMPVPILLRIFAGVLVGLHAAHEATDEQGEPMCVIHRDVSPDNILVGVDGHPRLIDFGIARALGRFSGTREGDVKGKLAYLSPEQVLGKPLNRQADLFAASIVMWQALTAKRLFPATNLIEVAHKILNRPIPSPSQVTKGIPEEIADLVMRGLERDLAQRWQTAEEMAEAIESLGTVASSREVGQYVARLAGERLANNARVVAAMAGAPIRTDEQPLQERLSVRPVPPGVVDAELAEDLASLRIVLDDGVHAGVTARQRSPEPPEIAPVEPSPADGLHGLEPSPVEPPGGAVPPADPDRPIAPAAAPATEWEASSAAAGSALSRGVARVRAWSAGVVERLPPPMRSPRVLGAMVGGVGLLVGLLIVVISLVAGGSDTTPAGSAASGTPSAPDPGAQPSVPTASPTGAAGGGEHGDAPDPDSGDAGDADAAADLDEDGGTSADQAADGGASLGGRVPSKPWTPPRRPYVPGDI